MSEFRKHLTLAVAAVALGSVWASAAKADFMQVALQDPTVNGGLIHIVNSSINGTMNWASTPYGNFDTNGSSNDTLTLGLPAILYSNTIDVSTRGTGTLTVYVQANDQTSISGFTHWLTTFSTNDLDNTATVTEKDYFLQSNVRIAEGDSTVPAGALLLQNQNLSGVQTIGPLGNNETITTPWSIIEVYTITATAANQHFNDTIDVNAQIPEPASLSLLGGALLGLGMWRRRRSQKA